MRLHASAAIDIEVDTSDEIGSWVSKEENCISDILWIAQTAQRNALFESDMQKMLNEKISG